MMEWIISSSVLIAVVILLRYALRGKLDLRLQYALWAVVLLRLLIPVSFGAAPFSVLNAAPAEHFTTTTAGANLDQPAPLPADSQGTEFASPETGTAPVQSTSDPGPQADTPLVQGLLLLWLAGVLGASLCFGLSNLCFARSLRRSRKPVDTGGEGLPVYVTDAVDTPCLFGLFRPAIYVTPAALAGSATLGHVLAHETTHFRHGDHLWAVLRGICVALHWYNPLVWWAAVLSRRDGETACDEDTIRSLGEEKRAAYGRTLLRMTCQRPSGLLTTATTMSGSARTLRERITLIAKKPHMKACTVVLLAVAILVAAGCTFTGKAASQDLPVQHTLTAGQEIPEAAIVAADQLIANRIAEYNEIWKDTAPGCSVAEAKLTGLTLVPTGVAGLEGGVELFRVEYRLRVEGNIEEVLAGGANYETIDGANWLTEWTSAGQPYLLLYWQEKNGETTWEEVEVAYEDSFIPYNSDEYLNQYGNKYTAYTVDRYAQHTKRNTGQKDIPLNTLFDFDVPRMVSSYAESTVLQKVEGYRQDWAALDLDCAITRAEITDLTPVNTGTATENEAIGLYQISFVLWVSGDPADVTQVGLISARESADHRYYDAKNAYSPNEQFYLILHCKYDGSGNEIWQPVCVTDGTTISQYTTDEMLEKYGNKYTAATMELYNNHLTQTAQ